MTTTLPAARASATVSASGTTHGIAMTSTSETASTTSSPCATVTTSATPSVTPSTTATTSSQSNDMRSAVVPHARETQMSFPAVSERGYFTYEMEPSKRVIMSSFGSPKRTVLDHAYCGRDKTTSKQTLQIKLFNDTITNPSSVEPLSEDTDSLSEGHFDDETKIDSDSDYIVSSECETSDEESDCSETPHQPRFKESLLNQKKYIVFEENLDELMNFCKQCGSPVSRKDKTLIGSMVQYHITCLNDCSYVWTSQPNVSPKQPAGNLLIAAGILMTGNTYNRINDFADSINLALISRTTFSTHQKKTLIPVIQEQWEENREKAVEELRSQEDPVILTGDARCDSPGYNAKYGSYTLMSANADEVTGTRKIIATEMVQVSEVKNSNHMEPEGLKRCLNQVLNKDKLDVSVLATDRHIMIGPYMRKEHDGINHQFDVWHVSKNVTKKLTAKAKEKGCSELGPWIQSISNHLWWCSATCHGNAAILKEKWLSLLHHITNRHSWTANSHIHKCEHTPLAAEDVREIEWLRKGSPAFKALQDIVMDKRLLNALPHLTRFCHTGNLEVFHTMLLKYCPKRQHFTYNSMKARLMLAALDWNCKSRSAVTNEEGQIVQDLVYSKRRKMWVTRTRYDRRNNHIESLMDRVVYVKENQVTLPPLRVPKTGISAHVARTAKPQSVTRISRFARL